MDSPIFKLEGVLKVKNEMSDFEGPLILILQLLAKDKIEIRDISISSILEQYLKYLDEMAEINLDIASEFVAMASHLMYIKTKMLLSGGEEISELEQLMLTLEELQRSDAYQQIKSAAEALSGMYCSGGMMMAGPPEYLPPCTEYKYTHDRGDLLKAIYYVLGRENAMLNSRNPREAVYPLRIVFSIPEKISEILEKLRQCGSISAEALFYESGSRSELIATLIAVLELCRVGSALLTGSAEELMIAYAGSGRESLEQESAEAAAAFNEEW